MAAPEELMGTWAWWPRTTCMLAALVQCSWLLALTFLWVWNQFSPKVSDRVISENHHFLLECSLLTFDTLEPHGCSREPVFIYFKETVLRNPSSTWKVLIRNHETWQSLCSLHHPCTHISFLCSSTIGTLPNLCWCESIHGLISSTKITSSICCIYFFAWTSCLNICESQFIHL